MQIVLRKNKQYKVFNSKNKEKSFDQATFTTLYDILQAHKCEVELQGAREQEQMLSEQVEQQDSILTQLQQELKAERERHSDTGRQLQQAKKNNIELQEDIDQYHKQVGDLSTTVSLKPWYISVP